MHTEGVFVVFCDAHVSRIHDSIELGVWQASASRAGGEVISEYGFG